MTSLLLLKGICISQRLDFVRHLWNLDSANKFDNMTS